MLANQTFDSRWQNAMVSASAKTDIREIISLLEADSVSVAEKQAAELLSRDPNNFDALHYCAVANARSGRFFEAIALFQIALDLRENVPDLHNNFANTLRQLGRLDDAIKHYKRALEIRPKYREAMENLGNTLISTNQFAEAVPLFREIVRSNPNSVKALIGLGVASLEADQSEGAIACFQHLLKLKPDDSIIHYKLGLAFAKLRWHEEAVTSYRRALELDPKLVAAHDSLGVALRERHDRKDALHCFQQAIELDKNYTEAHRNIGKIYKNYGLRLQDAIAAFQQALRLEPDHAPTHNELGTTYLLQRNYGAAIASFQKAIEHDSDYTEAYVGLGRAYSAINQHGKAISFFRRAIQLDPLDAALYHNLGTALYAAKMNRAAIKHYLRALELEPNDSEAHSNLALAYSALGRRGDAIAGFERALEIQPNNMHALGFLAGEKRSTCDWSEFDKFATALSKAAKDPSSVIPPFTFLDFSDEPADLLLSAGKFCRAKVGSITPFEAMSPPADSSRIRLAYVSADFHEHATAYLMAELFESHDREKFETYAISFGPDKSSAMRTRLEAAFDQWHEVALRSDREVAELMRSEGIHIAVDLKGYTKDCRPGILAYRPAPVQVNYLGYPGSMGAPFIDYILVDPYIVPADQQEHYSEKLVHLPHCYQANDRKREIAEKSPSRTDCGLPEEGFVFCCFNNFRKITPAVFEVWMRLLRDVDGSVLWLLRTNELAQDNLRSEAQARDIDPERLIFAPTMRLAKHLSRYRIADLFLDTLPYNAHTTASDALWAGLPLVTCAGKSFAARVAGSILRAAGVPELVTESLEDYEALARRLATEPDLLAGYRERLVEASETAPLFDCARFTRNMEKAYATMYERWRLGEPPEGFAVSE